MQATSISSRIVRLRRKVKHVGRKIVEHRIKPRLLACRIRHIAGPKTVEYGPDEVLLICVVRNGAYHVRTYIEYHLRLGVRHIVFLDNNSTDQTVQIAREYEDVTILQTDRPYHIYENAMKRYLAGRFSRGRWNLCADIDERFGYPFSDTLPLREFVRYLNRSSYTAVLAQMLDMFSDAPLSALRNIAAEDLRRCCTYYDISAIRKIDYRFGPPGHPAIKEHFGGIRRKLFGSDNGLTKAALVRVKDPRRLFVGWHHASDARVADVSCVLLHYPFAGAFSEKVAEAVAARRYGKFTADYVRYAEWLRNDPTGTIRSDSARELRSVNSLLDDGFLVASEEYLDWARARGSVDPARRGAYTTSGA